MDGGCRGWGGVGGLGISVVAAPALEAACTGEENPKL